ncbi:MAG: hypothetical protein ACOYT7_02985 [Patescibacteria group bacterium]
MLLVALLAFPISALAWHGDVDTDVDCDGGSIDVTIPDQDWEGVVYINGQETSHLEFSWGEGEEFDYEVVIDWTNSDENDWVEEGSLEKPNDCWSRSSLTFTTGCDGNCEEVRATVCNTGDGDMEDLVSWQLYYAASGNPKSGSIITSGNLGPLDSGDCETLTYDPQGVSGNYMFRAEQEEGHPGQGELWSNACELVCLVPDTETPTPTDADTPTATNTPTIIPREPTRTPRPRTGGGGPAETDTLSAFGATTLVGAVLVAILLAILLTAVSKGRIRL